jgi:hypothetical protein
MSSTVFHTLRQLASPRELRFRDSVVANVSDSHRLGLSSGLPFLKVHLCGQDVPTSKTNPFKPSKLPPGKVLKLPPDSDQATELRTYRKVIAFNTVHRDDHLQFVPRLKKDGFVLTQSETTMVGDLPVSTVVGVQSANASFYHHYIFQVFVPVNAPLAITSHECEHAMHDTLSELSGSPLIGVIRSEYLAMLAELIHTGSMAILSLTEPDWVETPRILEHAHIKASAIFRDRLFTHTGMSEQEVTLVLDYAHSLIPLSSKMQKLAEELSAIVYQFGWAEYHRVYLRTFGLPLNVMRSIIKEIDIPS